MFDIYINKQANKQRIALGKSGEKMLSIIGLNPSIATADRADATIARVEKVAKNNGYDGFVMFNLCPLRCTHINLLPLNINAQICSDNQMQIINFILASPEPAVWLAWGEGITLREYFLKSLVYVYETIKSEKINWLHFGPLTKAGHPRHPSRLNYQWGFDSFDLNSYILSRVSMPNRLRPSSKTLAVNPQSASRELRAGSSAFNTVT
jgi:hypothetical protein